MACSSSEDDPGVDMFEVWKTFPAAANMGLTSSGGSRGDHTPGWSRCRLAACTGAGPGLSPAAAGATASLVSSGDPGKLAGCMLSGLGRCIVDALGKGGQRTGQGMMEAVSKEALSGRSVRFARDSFGGLKRLQRIAQLFFYKLRF